jgi:hypothetical protein
MILAVEVNLRLTALISGNVKNRKIDAVCQHGCVLVCCFFLQLLFFPYFP